MKYFYSAAAMGFHGEGQFWHKPFQAIFGKFPKFPVVTKTITYKPIKATPWRFGPIPFTKSTWNRIGLHNGGFHEWCHEYDWLKHKGHDLSHLIPSLAGSDFEIQEMLHSLQWKKYEFKMVELNFSCPNIIGHNNSKIPKSTYPLSLKLTSQKSLSDQLDLRDPNIKSVKRITLNSIATGKWFKGAYSGEWAKISNWKWIARYITALKQYDISIAGCSITSRNDIDRLKRLGITEIGLGSILMINPWLVTKLKED